MKARRFPQLEPIKMALMAEWCLVAMLTTTPCKALAQTPAAPSPAIKVNRTVPHVEPPKTTLEFSASPTAQEIFRARVFEEPLVPVGGEPNAAENAALAAALVGYSKRTGPDDFSSLTGFLETHPKSPWTAALLTGLGLDYYNTAHYTLALDAFSRAWSYAKDIRDTDSFRLINRAGTELVCLLARTGRQNDLRSIFDSPEGKAVLGNSSAKLSGVKEALWMMQNRPEIAFRCGPLALHCIQSATDPDQAATTLIHESVSTPNGLSLSQVAELSAKIGMNYQMAFREKGAEFVVPAVVHWKIGHYAAMVRREGDRCVVEDPTFGNRVWPTKEALDAETSGYFLVPLGKLPPGWRSVSSSEGASVWGKGLVSSYDTDASTCSDLQTTPCGNAQSCMGMAVSSVHLMSANLQIRDAPIGYTPPVGPPVRLTVRYNSRAAAGPTANANFGAAWGCDWFANITDNPQNPLADVKYNPGGGGARIFTGFNTNTQRYVSQQYDQTQLRRTGTNSYELLWPDGSKQIFGLAGNSAGTSRSIFLTQIADAHGNALTLSYDSNFVVIAIIDAIGQVTTLNYGLTNNVQDATDAYKVTKVTDPFGRSTTFNYAVVLVGYRPDPQNPNNKIPVMGNDLATISDVLGISSQFSYDASVGAQIDSLATPYGVTSFLLGQTTNSGGMVRFAERHFPDGSRDRVEFNQGTNVFTSDPAAAVPSGMGTINQYLQYRNTYYWSRNACATGYGDYSKAKVYHWLHTADMTSASAILESTKEPLEARVWYDYPGQSSPIVVGSSDKPAHVGRVLDNGVTQLYTYAYNAFGHATNIVDPVGRKLSFIYNTNGIDLLEVRQTTGTNNELLARVTHNSQHRPLTLSDAAGQTRTNTYNARGQLLTTSNPKGETTTYTYDTNGYLIAADGPLPGTSDTVTATYDAYGRLRTFTDVSSYMLTFDYDAMDRLTQVTHPDSTYSQYTYNLLNPASFRDRAGRITTFEHDNMRQINKVTDALGQVTLFDWCRCGSLRSLIDPMGRKTSWVSDVEGRTIAKQYADGSQIQYLYENAGGRLSEVIDEKQQVTEFAYNRDNTISFIAYANSAVPTPTFSYAYDANYRRLSSMTDGTGTTLFSYIPITSNSPALGAGRIASVDGPLANDTVTFSYDELSRPVHRAINGVDAAIAFDERWRPVGASNALGAFTYRYEGSSYRLISNSLPNGQIEERSYNGVASNNSLHRITHRFGATPLSEFLYGFDIPATRVKTWSQQAGAASPDIYTFDYDAVNQLLSATVTNGGSQVNSFGYSYDPSGNRLGEQIGGSSRAATYNALNQLSTSTAPGTSRTNEWDAMNRLVAVNAGNQRTEFAYDARSRLVSIRLLTNSVQASLRRFVWTGSRLAEERDISGAVTKRFFPKGMKIESGANAGSYFYTRDHLGSIRELVDASGKVRARYTYDPYGRRTRIAGDLDADFGFAGMFWSSEASLCLTHFRAYDPELGRWLSRDPLRGAELRQGPNLYTYVRNEPIGRIDPRGLGFTTLDAACMRNPALCATLAAAGVKVGEEVAERAEPVVATIEGYASGEVESCAAGFADTVLPKLADAAESLGGVLPDADLILEAPDYEFVVLDYEWAEMAWVDANGEEILGEEAEILTENLGWANLYWNSALDNLARLGLPAGAQQRQLIDQIMEITALIRGSILP